MSVYMFVPARSGSTRIPDKNLQRIETPPVAPLREPDQDPLVGIAVDQAWTADGYARIVVSTDSEEIYRVANGYCGDGVEWHERPANLAGPNAQIEDTVLHWGRRADLADDDVIALIQPTSPFRRPESIRACIEAVQSGKAETALTVTRFGRLPFLGRKFTDDCRSLWERPRGWTRPRSQDVRHVPEEAGSVYAFTWRHLKGAGSRMCERPAVVEVDWLEAFEIDTPQQLEVARILAPHVERLRGIE